MKKHLLRGIFFLFMGQIGGTAINFLGTPILVRLLSKTEYGDFTFMLSVISIISIFASLGLSDGLRKHATEARKIENWKQNVIGYYFKIGFLAAIISATVITFIVKVGFLTTVLPNRFNDYFLIISLVVSAKLLFNLLRSILMIHNDEYYSESLKTLIPFLYIGLGIVLLLLGYGVSEILFSYLISILIVSLIAVFRTRRYVSLSEIVSFAPNHFPRIKLLSYNFRIYFQSLLATTLLQIDIILVTVLVGSQQTASYKAALTGAQFLWLAPLAIQTRMIYSTSELWATGQLDVIQNLSERITRYTFLFTCLLAIGLASLAPQFISFYFGEEYLTAVVPLYILLPGVICFAIARPIYGIEFGSESTKLPLLATFIAALINLVLNLVLIPRLGISGAAVATSIGYGSMLLFHIVSSVKLGFNPIRNTKFLQIIFSTVVTGILLEILIAFLQNKYVELLFIPPFGFIIFLIINTVMGTIKSREIKIILKTLKNNSKVIQRRLGL